MIGFWEREYTTSVVRQLDEEKLPPRERLLAIVDVVVQYELTRIDISMQAWMKRDSTIGRRIAKSFREREMYVHGAFAELGFKGHDLETRTQGFVGFMASGRAMFRNTTKHEAHKKAKSLAEILMKH